MQKDKSQIEEEIKEWIKDAEKKKDYKRLLDLAGIKPEDVLVENKNFLIDDDLNEYFEGEELTKEEQIKKLRNSENLLKFIGGMYDYNDDFSEYVRNRIMEDDDNRAEALDAAKDAYEYGKLYNK